MKKIFLILTALFVCSISAFSQQITKFGVVDTAKVYQSYFRNSSRVRDYDAKKSGFQAEINKRTEEIQTLQTQKADYEKNGNESAVLRLEGEITKKTDALSAYAAAKNRELESLRNSLQNSDAFYKKLYATLEKIAEAGGYSMILSLQQANAILWYSQSVDVTDKVIAELGLN